MTIEEITQKIEELSQELFFLGRACTDGHFQHDGKIRTALYIAGEFLKNTSFTMDAISAELTTE